MFNTKQELTATVEKLCALADGIEGMYWTILNKASFVERSRREAQAAYDAMSDEEQEKKSGSLLDEIGYDLLSEEESLQQLARDAAERVKRLREIRVNVARYRNDYCQPEN